MITKKQKEFLEKYKDINIEDLNIRERDLFNKTLTRIHEFIDRGLERTLWLAINHPDVLLDEARELEDESLPAHRRLMTLIKILNNLNPRFEVELTLKEKKLP